jgi:creatinine amidohydrolase
MKTNKKSAQSQILELKHMSWKQIDQLPREKTIFFLPISPMEEHGPHLPVGTDFLTANDAAKDAIAKVTENEHDLTCVLLPSVPLGFCKFNTDFPGSFSVSSKIIRDVVLSFGSTLAKHGFHYLIICTYHMAFGHLKGIYAAIHQLRKKYHMKVCEPWSPMFYSDEIDKKEPKLGFDTDKEVHGGFRETSLMKYQYPYLVDPKYTELKGVYRDLSSPKVIGKTFKELGIKEGYIGNPSKADVTYGRWFYQLTVDSYANAAVSLYQGKAVIDLPQHVKSKLKLLFWQ